jgi:Aerotolerance regulator N-terminal
MTFLAPLLLGGLALGSVPIVIHLLNRRRFTLIDWAPMRYLKLTLKSNRRRLRLEQWLLLAVRTLAVLLLFFAVARPVVSKVGLGGWLAGRARASRVLVIDDSLSMSLHGAATSAMDRAKQAATALIEAVGAQDSLTVLTTSAPRSPLVRAAHLQTHDDLTGTIRQLTANHTSNDWATTFQAIRDHLESSEFPIRQVTLVTDMRAQSWSPQVAEQARRWAEQGVSLTLIDVGAEPVGNTALVELLQQDPVALADTPLRLLAQVRNDGPEPIASPQSVLTLDGVQQTLVMPDLPPGRTIEVPITVTFSRTGRHSLSLTIPDDALPLDNSRWLTVDVRKSVSATLVDGEPGSRAFESETDFLALALSAGRSPWRVRLVDDNQWLHSPMTAPDVLVLANVAAITPQRAAEVERLVRAGMGLSIFLGDQVDTQAYERLVISRGGGLLPGRIERISDEAVAGLLLEPVADSPLAPLKKLTTEALAAIRPHRFAELVMADDPSGRYAVRVLATWNNAAQSPAVLEARIGKGRVLLWTVTADRAWSDWPIDPSYVLAMRETALSLAGQPDPGWVLLAGQPIRQRFDPQLAPPTARLTRPGRPDPVALAVHADPDSQPDTEPGHGSAEIETGGGPWEVPGDTQRGAPGDGPGDVPGGAPLVEYAATVYAGVYRLDWDEPGHGPRTELFSINPDPRESDLAPLKAGRLAELLGELDATVIPFGQDSAIADAQGAELWRHAVLALLVLIGVETLLAAWVTREH